MNDDLIQKGLAAKRESRAIEFKQTFDPDSKRDWCEVIKDVVALANSGGGVLIFGADNKGQPVSDDLTKVASIDPATIADRIRQYTGSDLVDLEVREAQRAGRNLLVWIVPGAATPLVFVNPGTYSVEGGKQQTAFGRGTLYFRHGAKSEPATTDDLAAAIKRRVDVLRKEWLGSVRKVVMAPAGSRVALLPPEVKQTGAPDAAGIRITNDPSAPAYRVVAPDSTYPFRQKEVIAEVRKRLPSSQGFNSFDVVALRRAYQVDQNPEFAYQPKFGSRQYSERFVDWIIARYSDDPKFFETARSSAR